MASQAFLQARDFLLRHRDDYATAYKDFTWPELTEFNWALDWFDEYARSNLNPALCVVEENGDETKLSYEELSARSNQLANWLRQQGVQRGDQILLRLPASALGNHARRHEARRRHYSGDHVADPGRHC